jgi:hypothetical protein
MISTVNRPSPSGVMTSRRARRGIRLRMARRTERDQAVEIEVRATLGALGDVVDLEGAPRPQAWQHQRARRTTTRRIAAHSSSCWIFEARRGK